MILLPIFQSEEEVDYNDPKFLAVTNPFWVEKGLDPRIIDILSGKGITAFTPVQAEAFLPVMNRRDVIGRSRTGTGKFGHHCNSLQCHRTRNVSHLTPAFVVSLCDN